MRARQKYSENLQKLDEALLRCEVTEIIDENDEF